MASSTNLTQLPSLAGVNAFTRPLSLADAENCVVVENAFPEQERCSKEKFVYRLTKCPELCLGLFIRTEEGSSVLIGHAIATRSSSNRVTDGSMEMPRNWQSLAADERVTVNGDVIGSEPRGGSVAVHSLAITPAYQGKGVGRGLMNAYIEYLRSVHAERIVIIAHDHLIRFYESVGFENRGPSACQFGWRVVSSGSELLGLYRMGLLHLSLNGTLCLTGEMLQYKLLHYFVRIKICGTYLLSWG